MAALRNLNLNIRRAKLKRDDDVIKHKFFITDRFTADKVRPLADFGARTPCLPQQCDL